MGNICYKNNPLKRDRKSIRLDKITGVTELDEEIPKRTSSLFKEDAILITKFNSILSSITDLQSIIEKFKIKLNKEIQELVNQNKVDQARSSTVYLIVCDTISQDIFSRKEKLEELKGMLEENIKESLTDDNVLKVVDFDWDMNHLKTSSTWREEERLNLISTCNKVYFKESTNVEKLNREIASMIKGYNYNKRKMISPSFSANDCSKSRVDSSRSNTSKSQKKSQFTGSNFSLSTKMVNNLAQNIQQKNNMKNASAVEIKNQQKKSLNVDFLKQDEKKLSDFLNYSTNGQKISNLTTLEKFYSNYDNIQSVTEVTSKDPSKTFVTKDYCDSDFFSLKETKKTSGLISGLELRDSKYIKTDKQAVSAKISRNRSRIMKDSKFSLQKNKSDEIGDTIKFPRVIFEKYDVSDNDITRKISEISCLKKTLNSEKMCIY